MVELFFIVFALILGITAYGFSWWVAFLCVSAGFTFATFIRFVDYLLEAFFEKAFPEDSK